MDDILELDINEDRVNALNNLTLVGWLLSNKRINHKAINAVLTNAWNLGQKVEIKSIDHNTITCNFMLASNRDKIMEAEPWAVRGAILNLVKWPTHVTLNELSFTNCIF